MKIDEKREGDIVVLFIEGRLDHVGGDLFDARVSQLIADGARAIVVDFHGVDFLASMGIRALIRPYQTLAPLGGRIVVANLSASVRSVFHIAGIDKAVPNYESVAEAVASF